DSAPTSLPLARRRARRRPRRSSELPDAVRDTPPVTIARLWCAIGTESAHLRESRDRELRHPWFGDGALALQGSLVGEGAPVRAVPHADHGTPHPAAPDPRGHRVALPGTRQPGVPAPPRGTGLRAHPVGGLAGHRLPHPPPPARPRRASAQ